MSRPIALELFCGAGGMTLGFEQAGFDVLAGLDLDPLHLATHEFNAPAVAPVCGDAATVTAEQLLQSAGQGWSRHGGSGSPPDAIDCLFGGPSCQGFSTIGNQRLDDPRNGLLAHFGRLVGEVRPRYFVLENVPGLVSAPYKRLLAELRSQLAAAGYETSDPWMLDAADFGVPQTRRRVFLVGWRRGEHAPEPPALARSAVSVVAAIDDLPNVDDYEALIDGDRLPSAELSAPSEYVKRLNSQPPDPVDLAAPRDWDSSTLTGLRRTRHGEEVAARFAALAPGGQDARSRLYRLHPERPSRTLRAGTGRDHGSFTATRPIHHRHPRVICLREAARLHGFPDWFRFHFAKWHGLRQIGNSVPPPLARAVAASVVTAAGHAPAARQEAMRQGEESLLGLDLAKAADRFGLAADQLPPDVRRNRGRRRAAIAPAAA